MRTLTWKCENMSRCSQSFVLPKSKARLYQLNQTISAIFLVLFPFRVHLISVLNINGKNDSLNEWVCFFLTFNTVLKFTKTLNTFVSSLFMFWSVMLSIYMRNSIIRIEELFFLFNSLVLPPLSLSLYVHFYSMLCVIRSLSKWNVDQQWLNLENVSSSKNLPCGYRLSFVVIFFIHVSHISASLTDNLPASMNIESEHNLNRRYILTLTVFAYKFNFNFPFCYYRVHVCLRIQTCQCIWHTINLG